MEGFQTDGGSEYTSKKMVAEYLKSERSSKEMTATYILECSGVVKQLNHTIMGCICCMLDDVRLSKMYWAVAVTVAVISNTALQHD